LSNRITGFSWRVNAGYIKASWSLSLVIIGLKVVKRKQEKREGSDGREKSDGFWRIHPTRYALTGRGRGRIGSILRG
jgi:hypothetical protein